MTKKKLRQTDFRSLAKNPSDSDSKQGFFSKLVKLMPSWKKKTEEIDSKYKDKFFLKKPSNSKKSQNNSKTEEKKESKNLVLLGKVFAVLVSPLFALLSALWFLLKKIGNLFKSPEFSIQICFLVVFLAITLRMAQLQVFSADSQLSFGSNTSASSKTLKGDIINARRGQIFIRDLAQSKDEVAVTTSKIEGYLWFNPANLKKVKIDNNLNIENAVKYLTAAVNLPFGQTLETINKEINKDKPLQYVVLQKGLDENQRNAIKYLQTTKVLDKNKQILNNFSYSLWIGVEEKESRYYPEGKLMAATLGYVPNYLLSSQEALVRQGCEYMVKTNQNRGTDTGSYIVGERGVEQKYCSVLGGLNGRKLLNNDLINKDKQDDSRVLNGPNIYLTIDRNIQRKAEQVLENSVQNNTNANGSPKDACMIVMDTKTGKLLAMASYPYFDPNEYGKYFQQTPRAFRNSCTTPYEVGSVMKPVTVASAINVHQSGIVESNKQLGVPTDFTFRDYSKEGKLYVERDGNIIHLRNSKGTSYENYGNIGIKQIIRDSINTGIAEITGRTSNRRLAEYFSQRFKVGKATVVSFPGDIQGDTSSFDRDMYCDYCFAAKGFGQGFSITPMQLARAYTALANEGKMVEPYIVDKIKCADGSYDDYFGNKGDCLGDNQHLSKDADSQVVLPDTAKSVVEYMKSVVEEGYLGNGSKAKIPEYIAVGKSGTAQVSRPLTDLKTGEPILDPKTKLPIACDQNCNTKRGIYDHTFVGFNYTGQRYLVMIKMAEPRPGESDNFSSDTLTPAFAEMLKYTLEYMNVPKDR